MPAFRRAEEAEAMMDTDRSTAQPPWFPAAFGKVPGGEKGAGHLKHTKESERLAKAGFLLGAAQRRHGEGVVAGNLATFANFSL